MSQDDKKNNQNGDQKEQIEKINAIIKDVKFAMMSAVNKKGDVHAWPMTTTETDLNKKEIWFIGDKTSPVVQDLAENSHVGLSYASKDEKNYVSLTARAELVNDKAKLDELWSPMDSAFFEYGKEDEKVQLIKIVPHGAECWISGNSIINAFKMTTAAIQDGKTAEDMGETFKIEL